MRIISQNMSAFVFNIACPRCDTAVKILLGKSEFCCSCCEFQVVVEDKDNLLADFKQGIVEDLDFIESPIEDPMGTMEIGLKLSFSKIASSRPDEEAVSGTDDELVDVDEFGNKTANTQIIQLTFDPAQYLEKSQNTTRIKRSNNKKISLKRVIKHAEKAKPPKLNRKQVRLRYLSIAAVVILAIVFIIFLAKNN